MTKINPLTELQADNEASAIEKIRELSHEVDNAEYLILFSPLLWLCVCFVSETPA